LGWVGGGGGVGVAWVDGGGGGCIVQYELLNISLYLAYIYVTDFKH